MPIAAAFEYTPPVASYVKALKNGAQPYLFKGAAAWLYLQWERMKWPLPDALVPVPPQRVFKVVFGKDHAEKLADELALFFQCQVIQPLFRKNGGISQGGKSPEQRQKLETDSFYLKPGKKRAEKVLFIIDDVFTTGRTMHAVEHALRMGGWKELYGLSLSISMRMDSHTTNDSHSFIHR